MALTNYPNGLSSFGIPLLGNIFTNPNTGGITPSNNVYWVNSNGVAGDGTSPSSPLLTYAAAIAKCTAAKGDVIVLMPGHAETVSTTNFSASISGVSVIGLGSGALRPTLTFNATGSTITVSAANCSFQNILCVSTILDNVTAFTVTTAKNLTIDSCEFRDGTSVNFIAIVTTNTTDAAADGLTITRSTRIGAGATALTCLASLGGNTDRLTIGGNYVAHALAANSGLILLPVTTKVITNARIVANTCNFVGANAATGGLLITTATTNSGVFQQNFWTGARAAASAIIVSASSAFIFMENYYQTAADKSGILIPANV